ncbi:unnamed protein product [Prorocentrum cordatum]|uniref:Beta-galactosidase n=1 Tax=Prorocentrum cordatum TaxID=2364126 RepID=A0ABN9W571_9DINO|nr:unnamed protein product [Polarella glacialis]
MASARCVGALQISRGQWCFDEVSKSGRKVFGVLRPGGEWLQGELRYRDGERERHGTVRLRFRADLQVMLSNFRDPGQKQPWGPTTVAHSVPLRVPAFVLAAVKKDGSVLRFAAAELRADREHRARGRGTARLLAARGREEPARGPGGGAHRRRAGCAVAPVCGRGLTTPRARDAGF